MFESFTTSPAPALVPPRVTRMVGRETLVTPSVLLKPVSLAVAMDTTPAVTHTLLTALHVWPAVVQSPSTQQPLAEIQWLLSVLHNPDWHTVVAVPAVQPV